MKKRLFRLTMLLVTLLSLPSGAWADEWSYDFFGYCTTNSGHITEGDANKITPTLGETAAFSVNGTSFFNISTPEVNAKFGIAINMFKLINYYYSSSVARIGLMAAAKGSRIGIKDLTTADAVVVVANAAPTVEGTNITLLRTIEGTKSNVQYGTDNNRTIENWNTYIYTISSAGSASLKFENSGNTLYSIQVTPLYTLTYDGNDNTGGSVPTDSNSPYLSGSTVTVLGNTGSLVKTGYSFSGWNTAAEGTGTDYVADATLSINANTTLYAKWTANNYTVTLDNQSATSAGTASVVTTYDTSTNLTNVITCPAKNGYLFGGYYTETDGAGTQLISSDGTWIASVEDYTDADKKWIHDGNVTLYAKWMAINLSAFSGTKTFTEDNTSNWSGVTKRITQYSPTTNPQFMAYSDYDNMAVNNGYGIQLGKTTYGGALLFYISAVSDITVNVKSNTTSTVKLDYMGSSPVTLTSEYNTSGTNCDSKELNNNTGTLTKSNAAAGYYKVYSTGLMGVLSLTVSAPTYSVTAVTSTGTDDYGTVSAESTSLAKDGTTTITGIPAIGYQVTNWAVSGTGSSIDPSGDSNSNTTTLTMGTADATVTCTFGPKSYTVTLDNQEATTTGTTSVTTTYNADTNLTNDITCPTKTGSTFGGYYTEENGAGTQLINSEGAWIASVVGYTDSEKKWIHDGNVTLYAKWTVSKSAGSISYAATEVTKTVGDAVFTNPLSHTGDGTVTYESSNTSVATVASDGKVTIKAVGSTTITATVAEGETYTYDLNTASYTLTVNAAGEEKTISIAKTWIFDDVSALTGAYATEYQNAYIRDKGTEPSYTIEDYTGSKLSFSDGTEVTPTKYLKTTCQTNGYDAARTAGQIDSGQSPAFAVNASVSGTLYA